MLTEIHRQGGVASIRLNGRFDFNTHRDFRAAYEPLIGEEAITAVRVDFTDVSYLDSSALGMLLMLREKLQSTGKSVSLTGVRGNVKQVLDIANFSKLFRID